MIDVKVNNGNVNVNKIKYKNDEEFNNDICDMVITLAIINALDNPNAFDNRLLNTLYIIRENALAFENGLKNSNSHTYKCIKETKKIIIDKRREFINENKNNKKS